MRVQVEGMDEVQDALAHARTDTGRSMRSAAAAAVSAEWVPALTARATRPQQRILTSGAGAVVSDTSFELIGGSGSLSGGLDHWYAVDYGMTPRRRTAPSRQKSRRTRNGRQRLGPSVVWVGRNLPSRVGGNGRVIYATIAEKAQDFVAAWVKGLMDQFEGTPMDVTPADELGQVRGSWR